MVTACINTVPWVALVALLVATGSFLVARRALRVNRDPALSFDRRDGVWRVRNVGKGTAYSVLIGESAGKGQFKKTEDFYDIAPGETVVLGMFQSADEFGAVYKDSEGGIHSSHCANDRTTYSDGNAFPGWEAKGKGKQK